jgi:hypothetical protein
MLVNVVPKPAADDGRDSDKDKQRGQPKAQQSSALCFDRAAWI